MKTASLLGHTFELFDLVEHDRLPADRVVDRFFRARHYLGSKDRRFIAEAVYGMLRHKLLIEELFRLAIREVNQGNGSQGLQPTIGLYLTYLLTIEGKDPAALSDSVGSYWKIYYPRLPLTQVAQAILRHRDLDLGGKSAVDRVSLRYSFPKWMVEEWLGRLGESETEALCAASNIPPPLIVRVNTLKTSVDECQERLR